MADFVRRGDVVGVQGFPGLLALVSPFVPPCPCVALPVCLLALVSRALFPWPPTRHASPCLQRRYMTQREGASERWGKDP